MKKDLIPVVIIGILAILGLFLIKETMIKGHSDPSETNQSTSKKGKITVEKNIISDNSASINYKIEAAYPEVMGLHNADAQKMINQQAYNLVESSINKFKNDLSEAQQVNGIPKKVFDQTSELTVTYSVGETNDKVVSFHFALMESVIGMAHPANTNQTLNFDAQSGKQLTLADLFQPNSNYLSTLSQLSTQQLAAKLGTQNGEDFFIKEGTEPQEASFKNFLVTPAGLQIIFDPATVAPDFAGTQTVTIPWRDLSGMLNTQYQER